ncbi:MAG TPA: WbuC family cupin fold metalloprotein [Polyangiaceae bacterium]|nr:WbuC family cupin fold metalloprotein [Polyangiaceae bacterium]
MSHPRALPAPSGPLCWLSEDLLEGAIAVSQSSPRRRVIQPLHRSDSATLHRMFNAVQPDSYIPPHRHSDPPKAESWIVLRGALAFFTFDDQGAITECVEIRAGGEIFGVDLEPGVYHTLFALEADTVVYEVKDGPYSPVTDKAFPEWAPREGTPEASDYLAKLRSEFAQRSKTKSA